MKPIKGFTIVEFMVVLLIAAIFVAFGVPSYYSLIQNNAVVGTVNHLAAGFHLARMEAVKRGVPVSVCSAQNANLTACGGQWSNGWIIFIDENNDNTINSTADIISVQDAPTAGVSINANQNLVTYSGSGFLSSNALNMSVRGEKCTGKNARQITITTNGRLSISASSC